MRYVGFEYDSDPDLSYLEDDYINEAYENEEFSLVAAFLYKDDNMSMPIDVLGGIEMWGDDPIVQGYGLIGNSFPYSFFKAHEGDGSFLVDTVLDYFEEPSPGLGRYSQERAIRASRRAWRRSLLARDKEGLLRWRLIERALVDRWNASLDR